MSELYPLPKHAPLLIALAERRNADSETYSGHLAYLTSQHHRVQLSGPHHSNSPNHHRSGSHLGHTNRSRQPTCRQFLHRCSLDRSPDCCLHCRPNRRGNRLQPRRVLFQRPERQSRIVLRAGLASGFRTGTIIGRMMMNFARRKLTPITLSHKRVLSMKITGTRAITMG